MEYRYLGKTGLKVSRLCLGSMQFGWTADEPLSKKILSAGLDAGINFIDTANVYSRWVKGNPGGVSETIIGNWIKEAGIPREKIILATKVRGKMGDDPNDEGLSRKHIMSAVEDSLRRLQTDYIDLYQTHFVDENTPVEVTLSTMDDLIHQGKVRYSGCSNYPAWRLMEALWVSDVKKIHRFETLQPHYNLVHRQEFEEQSQEVCCKYGLGVMPYSPLAAGFLTGKYRKDRTNPDSQRAYRATKYCNDCNWNLLEVMDHLGKELGGATISQLALAWLLANPVVTSPIIGPRSLEQLEDNLGAVEVNLSQEALQALNNASSQSADKVA